MSFKVAVKMEGLQTLFGQFELLKASLRKKHMKKAMTAAGKDVLWAVRKRTPRRTKLLYKSLGRKVKVYPSGVVVAIVGARTGYKQVVGTYQRDSRAGTKRPHKAGEPIYADPTKYLHLVELGTRRTKATRMLRDGAESCREAVAAHVEKALNDALNEAAKGGK